MSVNPRTIGGNLRSLGSAIRAGRIAVIGGLIVRGRRGKPARRTAASCRLAACVPLVMLAACQTAIPAGTRIGDGAIVAPPVGWIEYCKRSPMDPSCQATPLNTQTWNQLRGAQAHILKIRYVADSQQFNVKEFWTPAKTAGDCEDIALAARQRLLELGWPASTLRLATVFTETNEVHSVLTVEVSVDGRRETLVVDNRNSDVMSWDQLADKGYRFVIRQAANGRDWVKVDQQQRVASNAWPRKARNL